MNKTRRNFIQVLGALGGAAAFSPLIGCDSSSSSADSGPARDASTRDASTGRDGGTAVVRDSGTPRDAATDAGRDSGLEQPACESVVASIGTNHGHTLTVSPVDVAMGVEKTYSMAGGHVHMVTVTAQQFRMLAAGQPVTGIMATAGGRDGHMHTVTLRCAAS